MLDNAKDQCTVKDLKELLNELSNNGYDNMPIFLGNKTPLLNDAICISYAFDVGVYFKNTHYDKERLIFGYLKILLTHCMALLF